jgi:hypothetical protein
MMTDGGQAVYSSKVSYAMHYLQFGAKDRPFDIVIEIMTQDMIDIDWVGSDVDPWK